MTERRAHVKAPSIDETPQGVFAQPVNEVRWVHRDELRANDYNPNFVAKPELRLLKTSILSDGWTQPIVVRQESEGYEIVDGFHRWYVAADEEISAMTKGLVPITVLRQVPRQHQMMSTIRHNRARGTHHVLKMADVVTFLLDSDLSSERVGDLLGMEGEEIERMRDRGNMVKRGGADDFQKGWVPG